MRIDIACGRNIAGPEPFLNVLQRHAVCVQQRRAAVPEIMKTDLEILSAHVDAKEKQAPVILLEIRQGTYLLDGERGLQQLGVGEAAAAAIAADPKLQLLDEFMKEYGYEKTFENTKFIMFQANAERREKQ